MTDFEIKPQITVTAEIRRARSDCCGALLAPRDDGAVAAFTCQTCGQPCHRITGPPEEMTWHG